MIKLACCIDVIDYFYLFSLVCDDQFINLLKIEQLVFQIFEKTMIQVRGKIILSMEFKSIIKAHDLNLWLGVSTGRTRLGLCLTRTRPDIIGWGRFRPAVNPNKVSNQPSRVVSIFGCESVDFGFSNSPIFG